MKRSLVMRLFITITIVIASMFTIGIIVGRIALSYYFVQQKVYELRPQIKDLSLEISDTGKTTSHLYKQGLIIKVYDVYKNELKVFDDPFLELVEEDKQSMPFTEQNIFQSIYPYMDTVLMGKSLAKITKLKYVDGTSIFIGEPIIKNKVVIGMVFVIQPVVDYTSALKGFYLAYFLVTGAIIIIALMLIYIIIRQTINPLHKMIEGAQKMIDGNYKIKIDKNGQDEIGQLSYAFNALAAQLDIDSQAAARLEQTRRDYVANISHELRTPIASIRAMSETLTDNMLQSDKDKERYYKMIFREALRLQRLINDMLEISRIQQTHNALQKTDVDGSILMSQVYNQFQHIADDIDIYFTITESAQNMPKLYTNQDRLMQVIVILLDNAFKFTKVEGKVTIDAHYTEEKVYIKISDSGEGINEGDLPYVFERFYKSDKSHTGKGTGLGLAIAKQVIDNLGEVIEVNSQLGIGTEFTLTVEKFK
ncbi:sensor histidine kinase [Clostridium grantii]|uniref:histidine kinase n=1 Tax=Clostridium grantii DSM 8605 TaxID=1121316 RepID=A0A1M5UJL1_9CLOT|nr:HAMP domain-containing sensor histidine kinase [Clostridium grantii]SHH63262.1 Signal transduction histidine kinase [Clostridium grantii DSM 8605]